MNQDKTTELLPLDKEREAFEGKTTYIAFWASKGVTYNIIECCDITYQRREVATLEEMDKESNRTLADRICALLNKQARGEYEASKQPTEPAHQSVKAEVVAVMAKAFAQGKHNHKWEAERAREALTALENAGYKITKESTNER